MDRSLKYLEWFICFFLVILVVIMLVVGTMQVIWRYVLQHSLSWSEELMRYLYVWVTMIGMSIGIRRKGLAYISGLIDFISKKSIIGKKLIIIIGFSVQIVLFAFITIYGWKLSMQTMGQLSPALRCSMGYVYLSMPVGGILSLIYTADEIRNYLKN